MVVSSWSRVTACVWTSDLVQSETGHERGHTVQTDNALSQCEEVSLIPSALICCSD